MSASYDIDSPPDAADLKTGKVLAIVLGVVAGVVVFCGGLGFLALTSTYLLGRYAQGKFADVQREMMQGPGARAQARAFLDDLGAGRTEAAFGKTTKDFQQHWDVETLRRMADVTPALKGHTAATFEEELTDQGRSIFQGFVTGPNGRAEFRLELVREDGNWKIDRIHFP
jgi:hypothetical protein